MNPARRVLLNLVGEQPMPSLIPILQYRPDVAVFLQSDRTAPQVADVCAALELAGMDATQCVKMRIYPARFIRSADVIPGSELSRPSRRQPDGIRHHQPPL